MKFVQARNDMVISWWCKRRRLGMFVRALRQVCGFVQSESEEKVRDSSGSWVEVCGKRGRFQMGCSRFLRVLMVL